MDPFHPPLLHELNSNDSLLPHSHANDEAARRSMRANHGPRDALQMRYYIYTGWGMMSSSININHDNLNEVPTGEAVVVGPPIDPASLLWPNLLDCCKRCSDLHEFFYGRFSSKDQGFMIYGEYTVIRVLDFGLCDTSVGIELISDRVIC